MKNPWTRQRLEDEFIGREESLTLEFKSSTALLEDKVEGFVGKLTDHVGAFLNSEGGILIVGIEEAPQRDKKRAELAVGMSPGVPRSRMTASRLSSMLCDRISPASTSLIQVHPVVIDQSDGEDLLAFVIEVRPGVTAYQSADKKYYGRRSFSSNPLEDKEIRLRMLADERPRAAITFEAKAEPYNNSWHGLEATWNEYREKVSASKAAQAAGPPPGDFSVQNITPEELVRRVERFAFGKPVSQSRGRLFVTVHLRNVGVVTIRRCALDPLLDSGNPPAGLLLPHGGIGKLREVRFDGDDQVPLYPDRQERAATWEFVFNRGSVSPTELPWNLSVTIYLDGGLAVRESIDVAAALQREYKAFEDRLRALEDLPHVVGRVS